MLFRAWHRGFKEMDLILGSFADRRLVSLTEQELDQFEVILAELDGSLYHWITGREAMPTEFETPIMAEIRDFTSLAEVLSDGRSG